MIESSGLPGAMIGRTLSHYRIIERLGQGGMGQVFRARDTRLGRDVALKLLPDSFSRDPDRLARLSREAQLLASLNHPNVATLHGLEESEGLLYLVMELVPGETLAERISRGRLSVEECIAIFRQIAEALEAAHEKGIVHRDLKPANVIVTSEGRVKVLDFGLAKAVTTDNRPSELSSSLTMTREGTEPGVILGTASYMSPEQARGKVLDRRTDVWSFGCAFYEALSGRKAFAGETVSDVIAAILEREPDWAALPERTPEKIRALLRWCLEKDPRRRLRDIGDARIDFDEPRPAPRHRYLPWAAAALFLGLALFRPDRTPPEPDGQLSRFTMNLPPDQALAWVNDPAVALSPDGRRLAYVAGSGNDRKLYVRPMDRLESVPLSGTEGVWTAFFSPDGEWVGFYGGKTLKKVRVDSGASVTLCEASDPYGASWGEGDVILFAPSGNAGLYRTSGAGGSPAMVTRPDPGKGESSHRWPELLPDGKTALFTIRTTSGGFRVALLSLETGSYRILLEDASFARYAATGHVLYVEGNRILAAPFDLDRLEIVGDSTAVLEGVRTRPDFGIAHFALSRNGTLAYAPAVQPESRLVWTDRTGAVKPMTGVRGNFLDPRLSPDGRKLSLTIWKERRSDIWIYDAERDSFSRLTYGEDAHEAVWTPDGKRLTFRRGTLSNLYAVAADGSGVEQRLTSSARSQRALSHSPDGRTLLYAEWETPTAADLWLLDLEAQPSSRPLLETPFQEIFGAISPDGRWLAYTSDESGRPEVYVRKFPELTDKTPISNEGGVQPVWARNGRELFYRNGEKMMTVRLETDPELRASRPAALFQGAFHDPAIHAPQYDVTPDGRRFVMIESGEASPTRIEFVLGWFEELKARAPRPVEK
jgi:serine/threonine-protein kinase